MTAKRTKTITNKSVVVLKEYERHINMPNTEYRLTILAECAGKKYEFRILLNNSVPLGFNDHQCVAVLTPDGVWRNLTDSKTINAETEDSNRFKPTHICREKCLETINALADYVAIINS